MKKIFKVFGIMVAAALIGFTSGTCASKDGGNSFADQPVIIPADWVDPETQTTPLSGGTTYTGNSSGNKRLPGSPYGYELWAQGGENHTLTWYGTNQGGGAAFKAEWTNPRDFIGRLGYYWNEGKPYTNYKNVYADYNFTRSENGTAGNYSYIGVYGWSKNPLIEWYIVDDWFGTNIITPANIGGAAIKKGEFTVDGATYFVYQATRPGGSGNIDGSKDSFPQYYSIRQTRRQSGTISVTEHFKQWEKLGLKLGSMYEAKFLVEAGGGIGWLDLSYLKFRQEDPQGASANADGTQVNTWNSLTVPSATKALHYASFDGKNDVLHIAPISYQYDWAAVLFDLSAYGGQEIQIDLSMDVLSENDPTPIVWQINAPPYPLVAGDFQPYDAGIWHTISGTWTGTVGTEKALYLSSGASGQLKRAPVYITNFSLTITQL